MADKHYHLQNQRKPKTLFLKSRENQLLEVDEDVAFESLTIQAMSKQLGPKSEPPMRVFMVPLTTELLTCVMSYCQHEVQFREDANRHPTESIKGKRKQWEQHYNTLDFISICDLLLAATYMDVPSMAKMLSTLAAHKMPRIQMPSSSGLPPPRRITPSQ